MSHSRKLFYSFLITLVFTLLFSLLNTKYLYFEGIPRRRLPNTFHPVVLSDKTKKTLPPASQTIDVVARVGGYAINTLSGWTSPFAEVSLSFQGITRKTLADETGFFIFTSVPFPDIPEELCLISQDVNQLPSFPLCLAPPSQNKNTEIKDILLSPSISLEESKISAGKTTKASGMTFPRSPVQVYLFTEKHLSFWVRITKNFQFIRSAFAANFPVYETESNENGYFEFSLPSSEPSTNHLFVSAIFNLPMGVNPAESAQNPRESQSYSSPKSNTLSFQIIGLWGFLQLLWKYFLGWIIAFRFNCDDLWLIVLIEILILMVLLFAVLAGKGKRKKETQRRLKEIKGTPSSIILYHPLKIL